MIPPPFEYAAPRTIAEAVGLIGQTEGAKILAGGQSLIPMMRFRLAAPPLLVDINRIDGLEYIRESDDWLMIGALTRETMLDQSQLVKDRYPLLADTTRVIADPVVRNRATIGGNLAHADPANDHPAAMLAYGAQLVAEGANGKRLIRIEDFFTGPFESSLAHGEILTEIQIPTPQPRSSGAYQKMERKVGDFATAAVAVQITLDENMRCSSAGIALTNVALTPVKASQAEASLIGQEITEEAIRHAAQLAGQASNPQPDVRGTIDYKRALVRTLTTRALHKALERIHGGMA